MTFISINIENVYIRGQIDVNFLEKNLCHSRDSNHRSPVLRTGALVTCCIHESWTET